MTTIISSQRFLDNSIIEEKIAELESNRPQEIVLLAWDVNGDCAVLSDGHHTLEAASQLGISVEFQIARHPEGLKGEDLLERSWMDSDWYDVKTGKLYF